MSLSFQLSNPERCLRHQTRKQDFEKMETLAILKLKELYLLEEKNTF